MGVLRIFCLNGFCNVLYMLLQEECTKCWTCSELLTSRVKYMWSSLHLSIVGSVVHACMRLYCLYMGRREVWHWIGLESRIFFLYCFFPPCKTGMVLWDAMGFMVRPVYCLSSCKSTCWVARRVWAGPNLHPGLNMDRW